MIESTPVCSYYLVREGTPNPFLGYNGSSLKRCSRCKGACYSSVDAQKLHWKTHKKVCKLSNNIDTSGMNLDHCQKALESSLCGGSPDLYFTIKRVRELFDSGAEDSDMAAFHLHSVARGLMQLPTTHMLGIVASPHMASLLFGDEEDLLSEKCRLVKYTKLNKYNGRPSEEFLEDIEDEAERKEVKELVDRYDNLDESSFMRQPSSCSFCNLYFNLIVCSTIQGRPSCSSTHDGNGILRGGNPKRKSPETILSTAALRRAMELWTDPLVLESCGDAMAPAASLALTAVQYYRANNLLGDKSLCNAHELVPGLAIDRLAMTCMKEILDGAGSASYSTELLKTLKDICVEMENNFLWHDLSISRRARFAHAYHEYVQDAGDRGSSFYSFGRGSDMPDSKDMDHIFRTIVGLQHPNDMVITKSVLKAAAEDGEFCGTNGAGLNSRARAFYYYLLRSDSREEGILRGILTEVTKLMKDFDEIPALYKALDDPKAKEADECLRLARGDKRHAEINGFLSSMQ